MPEGTDASTSSGSPPDAPTTIEPTSGDSGVHDILAVADQVLSLERKHATEKSENDEALEWHEVIELQAFSERRAWIEEKIKVRSCFAGGLERRSQDSSSFLNNFLRSRCLLGSMLCAHPRRRCPSYLLEPSCRHG